MKKALGQSTPKSNPGTSQDDDQLRTFKNFDIGEVHGDDPSHSSQEQLDKSLDDEKAVIVIKDLKLGNRTVLWMGIGKCVHNMALVTAMGSIICSTGVHENLLAFSKPLAVSSVAMNISYYVLWHRCPLMKYRIAQNCSVIRALKDEPQPPTIIVRKVIECTRYLHIFASAAAVVVAFWKDAKSINFKENFRKIIGKTTEKTAAEPPQPKLSNKVKEIFDRSEVLNMQTMDIREYPDVVLS